MVAEPVLQKMAGLQIEGVMTTLAEYADFDSLQVARLNELVDWAREKGIDLGLRHAVSSGGLLGGGDDLLLDMVRPGLLLYGHYPSDDEKQRKLIDLRPAMTVKARVAYVKTVEAGDAVSYHRTFVADRPTRVATLPIGYSNGYPRALVGRGSALIGGNEYPLLSLITMNHCQVRIEGEHDDVREGAEAVLVGRQGDAELDLTEVGKLAELSAYQLMTRFSSQMPRKHVGA